MLTALCCFVVAWLQHVSVCFVLKRVCCVVLKRAFAQCGSNSCEQRGPVSVGLIFALGIHFVDTSGAALCGEQHVRVMTVDVVVRSVDTDVSFGDAASNSVLVSFFFFFEF